MADATAHPWTGLKVVLVHDWLTGMRGGEKVLESLCAIFPDAEILTLVHARGRVSAGIESHRIRTSPLQRLPGATRRYRQMLPLFPSVIEWFDLDDVDLVVSTSHCAVKSVVPTARARHICYCHSPMRYAWDQFDAYFGRDRLGAAGNAAARHVMAWLARWDRSTAHRVDRFVANSRHVAGRIGTYYRRDSDVLHPPVDVDFFTPTDAGAADYMLVVSALVPYKRLDLAIRAAAQSRVPLHIVGSGPDEGRLRAMAGSNVSFLGTMSDVQLREEYRRARALLLPGEEDFGIAPVESLAVGRPVIALGRGGVTDSITNGTTGVLVEEPTAEAFASAMSDFNDHAFDRAVLRQAAERFAPARFDAAFRAIVTDTLQAAR